MAAGSDVPAAVDLVVPERASRRPHGVAFGREGGREFSATAFGFWFGGTVLFNLNEQWFIGGDFKLPIFTGAEPFLFPTPSLTGGLNF